MLAARASREEATHGPRGSGSRAVALGARPLVESIEGLAARAELPLGEIGDAVPVPAVRTVAAYELTARELEVLRLVVAGRTNRQIGEELFISESTAGVHVSRILAKFGVAGRVEAATIAAGWASPTDVELRVIGGCGAWPRRAKPAAATCSSTTGSGCSSIPATRCCPGCSGSCGRRGRCRVRQPSPSRPFADLNPLLGLGPCATIRRRFRCSRCPALDAVLALDRPGMLDDAYDLREFEAGDAFRIGPLAIQSAALPHSAPNAGVRSPPGSVSRTPGTPHPTPR